MKNATIILFASVCFGLFLSPAVSAQQTDNGGLTGTVTDPNGAVVPGATVTVTNLGTNAKRTITTNEEGRWTFAVLPLGNYQVTAEAAGFQPGEAERHRGDEPNNGRRPDIGCCGI